MKLALSDPSNHLHRLLILPSQSFLSSQLHRVNFSTIISSSQLHPVSSLSQTLLTHYTRKNGNRMDGRMEGGYKKGQKRRTDNCLGSTLFPTAYLMRLQMSLGSDSCWRIRKEFPQLLGVQVHQGIIYQPQLQQRDSKGEK